MNIAQIRLYDVANGLGIRTTVFFSGCSHHCKGCFNKEYWDFNYGRPMTQNDVDTIIQQLKKPEITGLTILGGEPFQQEPEELLDFITQIKKAVPEKTIWIYTGYTYEELSCEPIFLSIFELIEVLVDGLFIEEKKNLKLRFKGSENQRIIDVQKTLQNNKVVLYDLGD